ncbi:MAG: hypothetical protein KF768_02245 [Phycisphaeraceae bacterium]|nr:hypothetical protein [Phycisphaeraceae bacterium]
MADVEVWKRLLSSEHDALRAEAEGVEAGDVAGVARLRRRAPAEIVSAALELAEGRRRLAGKWPERWRWMVADRAGAEMATSGAAAAHKAGRFARVFGAAEVMDLCCGIGADAIGLVEAGMKVTGVDVDPARAWMCAQNAGCGVRVGDVGEMAGVVGAVHLDPARRSVGGAPGVRGRWMLVDHAPGPGVWRRVVETAAGVAIKLGPGTDREQVVEALGGAGARGMEVEYVSEGGRMTQAVVWTGALAGSTGVSATMLGGGGARTIRGEAGRPGVVGLGRYVYEPDPALERARLLAALCEEVGEGLGEMHAGLGLLSSDARVESAWCAGFGVLEVVAYSVKRLREVMRSLDAGVVEVKTRGGACDTDALQKELRGEGSRTLTVFVLRLRGAVEGGGELTAIVAERLPTVGR